MSIRAHLDDVFAILLAVAIMFFFFVITSAKLALAWPDEHNKITTDPRSNYAVNASSPTIEHGEDLPGSWFQQSNGGRRYWTVVSGEFNSRRT